MAKRKKITREPVRAAPDMIRRADDREHPYDDDPADARGEDQPESQVDPFRFCKRRSFGFAVFGPTVWARLRAKSTPVDCAMYRMSHIDEGPRAPRCQLAPHAAVIRGSFAVIDWDGAEPVGYADLGAVLDEAAAEAGESNRANGFHVIGFTAHPEMQSQDDQRQYAPRKSKRNLDKEKRARGTLREQTRVEQGAFHDALPGDILDRLVVPSGDDVRFPRDKPMKSWGLVPDLPIRHPGMLPTWKQACGEQRDWFTAAPKLKLSPPPGIAVGWETEAMDCLAFRNIHGIRVGLLASERHSREDHVVHDIRIAQTAEKPPKRAKSGKGRSVTMLETLAWCAVSWTTPSFVDPEPECDVFDIKDLLTADALPLAA